MDTDAIAAKVKQEFAAKDKAKTAKKDMPKPPAKQTDEDSKKAGSSLILNPSEITCAGSQTRGPALFLCPCPSCPPSCVAPTIRQERHH